MQIRIEGTLSFEAIPRAINPADLSSENVLTDISGCLANYIGLSDENVGIKVYSNRGTSGIDGSNGAAVGQALVSKNPVFLITGDLAFFYDRNAFWHNYDISRLHIVLLNNHSGGIFGVIDGPSDLPELEEYFETNQKLTAKNTARDFGFEYVQCSNGR